MDYLLDGYNCANWLARDPDLDAHQLRQVLYGKLTLLERQGRLPVDADRIRVFWDSRRRDPGISANEYHACCEAHNVPDADEAIIDTVRKARQPGDQTIISRDREVTGKSRQLGGRTMTLLEFFGRS